MMKKLIQRLLFLAFLMLILGASCDKYEKGEGFTGVWRCRENYQGTKFRTYNVSVERYSGIDSNTYVIYNMYNLGLDLETVIQLKDTVFTIFGTNSDSYFITGKGAWSKSTQAIEWEYSVLGLVNDPYVSAVFDRP